MLPCNFKTDVNGAHTLAINNLPLQTHWRIQGSTCSNRMEIERTQRSTRGYTLTFNANLLDQEVIGWGQYKHVLAGHAH